MKITKVDLYELEIPPILPIARYLPRIFNVTLCRIQTDLPRPLRFAPIRMRLFLSD